MKSILFDLDNTLCDCAELHYISLNKALLAIAGIEINREEHNVIFNGLPTNKKLEILIKNNKINEKDKKIIWDAKQQYTIESINEVLNFLPEKIEMHEYLKSKYKLACITNSIYSTASLILEKTGQLKYMDLIISNDMIKNPKPHPEGFIRAMITFNSMPEETLIVEDSAVGEMAAKASGANLWKVKDAFEVNLLNIKNVL